MKLVKFENGTFGVRKYWFFGWHFVDLEMPGFDWDTRSRCFPFCQGSELDARHAMKLASDKGLSAKHTVIK